MRYQFFQTPFPHVLVENFMDEELLREADAVWPSLDWSGWGVHYNNALEKDKRACNDWSKMPSAIALCLSVLAKSIHLPKSLGVSHSVPDCTLWGAGMHSMTRGSHLDVHEDSDFHPKTGWHRRVNGILFVGREVWDESWNGALEFWNKDLTRCEQAIYPKFNRLVLFAVDDQHYHGVPKTIFCPEGVQRKTLTMFWFTQPRKEKQFKRPRANFVATAQEAYDPEKEALRLARGQFSGM